MKCHNCGFEAENNAFCPICGTQLAQNAPAAPAPSGAPVGEVNPYQQTPNNGSVPPQYGAPVTPYPPQAMPNPQNVPPQANPYPQNANPYSAPNAPVNPYHPAPPAAPQQGGAYPPPAAPYVPKKKSKAAPIVLGCIIGTVVLAGIAIAILSAVIYNSSLFEAFSSRTAAVDEPDYDYLTDTDDDLYFNDYNTRRVGQAYDFAYGRVTLQSVEASPNEMLNGKLLYSFTVEIENNTDEEQSYFPEDIYIYYDADVLDESFSSLYMQLNGEDYEYDETTLKPGDTATLTCYYMGAELDEPISLYVQLEVMHNDNFADVESEYEVKQSDVTSADNAETTAAAETTKAQ